MADFYENLARVFNAVSEESRLRIITALTHKPYPVNQLARFLGLSLPTVSEHLKILYEVGFLTKERRGTWVYYSLRLGEEQSIWMIQPVLQLIKQAVKSSSERGKELEELHKLDRESLGLK